MLSPVLRAFIAIPAVVFPVALLLPAGCTSAPPAPVAVVTVGLNRIQVPFREWIDVTIQFDVAPALEPLNEDYQVLLHVLDDNESFLWADDHDPPVPTSTWRPGQTVRYTRRVRVPAYVHNGPAVIAAGLYSPRTGARLPLTGTDLGEFVYRVATAVFEPPHERSFVVFESGWHGVEFDPSTQTDWRWTTGRAVLSFRNPHCAARLRLDVQRRSHPFERPQRLALVVGDRTIRETTLNTNRRVHLDYDLTAVDLGGDDVVRLELLIDQTSVPSEENGRAADTRELGVRVFDAYVELPPT